jgi:uncharacterized XkdX family phage protein
MDWFKVIFGYYNSGYYKTDQVKVFVLKGKITADQYQQITGLIYNV